MSFKVYILSFRVYRGISSTACWVDGKSNIICACRKI